MRQGVRNFYYSVQGFLVIPDLGFRPLHIAFAMSSTKGLVPITRTFLAKFYEGHPFDPLVPEVSEIQGRLATICDELEADRRKSGGAEGFVEKMQFEIPHKVDENLWKNREQIEELIDLLGKDHLPVALQKEDNPQAQRMTDAAGKLTQQLQSTLEVVSVYQANTGEKVFQMVLTYMPQDFRGTLIKQQRERSEVRRQAEVKSLLANGGSIAQKYALLWQQQMDRRKTLASLGSATGVYRTLVKYLVGVPQVLLDFVKQLNEHDGPMEEQRSRYGPPLYELSRFVNQLRIFVALWWEVYDERTANFDEYLGLVERAVAVYSKEFVRFVETLRVIFENAPFLISAEEADTSGDELKEVTIGNGYKHEVPLTVECEGSMVAWEFKLTSGKDVGFSVDFIDASGKKSGMLPYQRLDSHQGSFSAPGVGSYMLVWDNSYSILNRKTVQYKVGAIPPVVDEHDEAAEEALAAASGAAPRGASADEVPAVAAS